MPKNLLHLDFGFGATLSNRIGEGLGVRRTWDFELALARLCEKNSVAANEIGHFLHRIKKRNFPPPKKLFL